MEVDESAKSVHVAVAGNGISVRDPHPRTPKTIKPKTFLWSPSTHISNAIKIDPRYLELPQSHPHSHLHLRTQKPIDLRPSSGHPQHICQKAIKLAHPIWSCERSTLNKLESEMLPPDGIKHYMLNRISVVPGGYVNQISNYV